MTMDDAVWIVMIVIAAAIIVPLALFVLLFAWPLILCWHLGHPVVGVIAEIIWLGMMGGSK